MDLASEPELEDGPPELESDNGSEGKQPAPALSLQADWRAWVAAPG